VKHIPLIVCFSAAEESLIHYIVRSQNSSPVQEYLEKQRLRFGRDVILKSHQKPYINAGIFLDYNRTVFLPYLVIRDGLGAFAEEVAVSLIDNCSPHVSDDVIRLLTEARLRVAVFPLYTTKILQILDLTLFGVLKRHPRYESEKRFHRNLASRHSSRMVAKWKNLQRTRTTLINIPSDNISLMSAIRS
jgi:hypothetical protein